LIQEPPQIPEDLLPKLGYYLSKLRLRVRFLWRKLVPAISRERRAEVQVNLRDAAEPDFSYFVLVLLSCIIATLGLLINSPATIIGAMLVAPLMSPILGFGLASIRGDPLLLRNSVSALIRGAILAIALSFIITWMNDRLPFISLQELPREVVVRTRPSPIDLGVALAGGLAATFALVQPELSAALPGVAIATALMPPLCVVGVCFALGETEKANGALLLFFTNAVTIASASIALFFALGFSRPRKEGEGFLPRSLVISAALTIILLAPLGVQSFQFVQQATEAGMIDAVINEKVKAITGAEVVEMVHNREGDTLSMTITVRAISPLRFEDSVAIQEAIAVELQMPVQLKINQVFAAQLDPRVPPTFTSTPTETFTVTPGPSATLTFTVLPTDTETITLTPTLTNTTTYTPSPTNTSTSTPTPYKALVARTYGNGANLRQNPGGPSIGFLSEGSLLTVLYGYEIVDGWVWIEVMDEFGRVGWLPQFYTLELTPTPTSTSTATMESEAGQIEASAIPTSGTIMVFPSPTASLTPTP
jgi:uncharacterized hydrophobic protein (TIGR00271 family)